MPRVSSPPPPDIAHTSIILALLDMLTVALDLAAACGAGLAADTWLAPAVKLNAAGAVVLAVLFGLAGYAAARKGNDSLWSWTASRIHQRRPTPAAICPLAGPPDICLFADPPEGA
jgi:hypothetical protein